MAGIQASYEKSNPIFHIQFKAVFIFSYINQTKYYLTTIPNTFISGVQVIIHNKTPPVFNTFMPTPINSVNFNASLSDSVISTPKTLTLTTSLAQSFHRETVKLKLFHPTLTSSFSLKYSNMTKAKKTPRTKIYQAQSKTKQYS